MAGDPSPPTELSTAIVELSAIARAARDRGWQRQLLDLAATCSAYSKVPRPEEVSRILAKARGLAATATQLGDAAAATAATRVVAVLHALPSPETRSSPTAAVAPLEPARATQGTTAPWTLSRAAETGLPATAPLSPTAATPAAPDPPAATTGGRPLVLIVDNDPESRRVLVTYFGMSGFRVEAFDDGSKAISRIRDERPALLVTDLPLPMMPGEVLILALRRSPATATIPILVVTAEPWRLGPEHEVDGVLTKPINVTTVVDAARRLISAKAGTDALRTVRA